MRSKVKLLIFSLALLVFLSVILFSYKQTDKIISSPSVAEYLEDKGLPNEIGEFKVGDDAPFKPGEEIQESFKKIPPSKFYMYLWSPNIDYGCVYEECGKNGEVVASLRGWLQGTGTTYSELVPLVNSSKVESLILVADKDSKVVGVYPNKDMPDILNILAKHKDLVDFKMLEGIKELGNLELNSMLPFDPANYAMSKLKEEIKTPNYYLIVVHETISDEGYCPYRECGVFLETIFEQKGWFISINHKNPEIIEKLGLDANQVAQGEITLIVLADKNKKIVSIHPNYDIRDIYTVLAQHPELAPFKDFPWR